MRKSDIPDFGADAYVHNDGCVYSADRTVLLACISELESCEVLDTCTSIAAKAFKSCKHLKRVKVPNDLVEVGDFAFAFSGLEEFDCPPALRRVGKKAFYSCTLFRRFTASNVLELVGEEAFSQTALERLELPASLRELGKHVVRSSRLSREFMPGALTMAPDNSAFVIDENGALYARTPEGLVLYELLVENVREHEVLAGTVRVAPGAYRYNERIERIVLPDGLVRIGNGAFARCTSLREVRFPESLESIGADAFHAAAIRSLHLPASLERVGMCALMATNDVHGFDSTLEEIVVHPDNPRFYTRDQLLIERVDGGERLICHFGKTETVRVPACVTEIGPYAFLGCEDVDLLELHDGIRRIHCSAFVLEHAIRHVRVRLSAPVCGKGTVDVYFPQETSQFVLFARAFYETIHGWQEITDRGMQFSGMYCMGMASHSDRGTQAPDNSHESGYAFSVPGAPVTLEERENASSYAFNQYEGGLDVRKICESSDRVITTLHHNIYLYARLALHRLETPQYLNDSNKSMFIATLRRRILDIVVECARHGDIETLSQLVNQDIIDAGNIDACVEAANTVLDITASSFLLQMKRECMGLASFDFRI